MLFHRFQHRASRLMSMRAITKTAVGRELEYLLEIGTDLLWLHIKRAKAAYSRRIN